MSAENLIPIAALIGAIGGSISSAWGIYQYRGTQIMKRKEILFELVKEKEEGKASERVKLIRDILDKYKLQPESHWAHRDEKGYYALKNLPKILNDEEDPGAVEIQKSLDELLRFFNKIQYLRSIGVIKKGELKYFMYLIGETMKHKEVGDYADEDFPLYKELVEDLKKEEGRRKKKK